jgi:hypothetical protein
MKLGPDAAGLLGHSNEIEWSGDSGQPSPQRILIFLTGGQPLKLNLDAERTYKKSEETPCCARIVVVSNAHSLVWLRSQVGGSLFFEPTSREILPIDVCHLSLFTFKARFIYFWLRD